MGVAVVLQIEQKMERQEIGDMERNKRGGTGTEGKGEANRNKDECSGFQSNTYHAEDSGVKYYGQLICTPTQFTFSIKILIKLSEQKKTSSVFALLILAGMSCFLLRSQRSVTLQSLCRSRQSHSCSRTLSGTVDSGKHHKNSHIST